VGLPLCSDTMAALLLLLLGVGVRFVRWACGLVTVQVASSCGRVP
jgi:hypothetical protein